MNKSKKALKNSTRSEKTDFQQKILFKKSVLYSILNSKFIFRIVLSKDLL